MNSSRDRQGQIPGRGSLVGERPGGKVARAPGLSVGQAAAPEWAGGAFLAASTWGPFRAGSPFPGEKAVVLEVPEEAQHAGSNRSRNRFRAYTGAHF